MTQTDSKAIRREVSVDEQPPSSPEQATVTEDEWLELLGDEYTRAILRQLVEKPKTARELIEATSASKPTVYRRLNKLEQHGLVDHELAIRLDGHHARRYIPRIESIKFLPSTDELDIEIVTVKRD